MMKKPLWGARHLIHYRLSDGEITQQITCPETSVAANSKPTNGCSVVVIEDGAEISAATHRIDLTSGQVVPKTPAEIARAQAIVAARRVAASIASELARTDKTQLADYPISAADRTAWASYRQALRDLSKKGFTPIQQIAAWPPAPDGRRAAPFLTTLGEQEVAEASVTTFHVFDKENVR